MLNATKMVGYSLIINGNQFALTKTTQHKNNPKPRLWIQGQSLPSTFFGICLYLQLFCALAVSFLFFNFSLVSLSLGQMPGSEVPWPESSQAPRTNELGSAKRKEKRKEIKIVNIVIERKKELWPASSQANSTDKWAQLCKEKEKKNGKYEERGPEKQSSIKEFPQFSFLFRSLVVKICPTNAP